MAEPLTNIRAGPTRSKSLQIDKPVIVAVVCGRARLLTLQKRCKVRIFTRDQASGADSSNKAGYQEPRSNHSERLDECENECLLRADSMRKTGVEGEASFQERAVQVL